MSELPDSWVTAPLGELLSTILGGGTPSKANPDYFRGSIPFMTVKDMHGRFIADTQDHITEQALESSASALIPADTLVVASRMSLGKVARPQIPVAINQDLKALFLHEGVDKTYIEYAWRSKESEIQAMGTGTTVKGIRLEDIRGLEIPVAPSAEQTRIADQLDKLLARIQSCNDRLDAIPALLKRFRQAVLESAMYGAFLDTEKPTEVSIASIAAVGTGSTPLRSNARFFASSGVPWVTSAATSNQLIAEANEFVTQEAIAAHRLKLYPKGTLLVAMYGEGKTRGQVAELGIEATINQACAAVVVDETKALITYVKLAFQVNYLAMRELAEGGNQPNLNLSKVKEFRIPLPSLEQQERIVREANSLLQVANRIEARYTTARIQAQRLSPLLLAKAFRGELVPQDPNDEPASALLERITTEREKTAAQPLARKSSAGRKPVRAPKENASMKSRQDEDVHGQPYLARHLRLIGGSAPAEALFKASELPVADFYKQLAWEVANGHLRDGKTVLELGDAA